MKPTGTIRSSWARKSMRVPELERLLDAPLGARIGDQFESLRVRVAKAVERIEERAGATRDRLESSLYFLHLFLGFLVVILATWGFSLRTKSDFLYFAGGLVPVITVVRILWAARRDERTDIETVVQLHRNFRADLEAARTAEDLQKLGERIRREMREAIGELGPCPTAGS